MVNLVNIISLITAAINLATAILQIRLMKKINEEDK